MDRRTFISAAGAASGMALATKPAEAAVEPMLGGLKHPKLRIAIRNMEGFVSGTPTERLEQLAAWGAAAYERPPRDGDPETVRAVADRLGLELTVGGGTGGINDVAMADPAQHDHLVEQFKRSIPATKALGCNRALCLYGQARDDIPITQQNAHVVECLKRMGEVCEQEDMVIVMETLNVRVDHPGYLVATTEHTMDILEAVGNPRVKMLFDIYHQQISEGNVIRNLTENIGRIGHFHFADNPGRHEPGTGELNYTNIFKAIAATDYDGFVAAEFSPSDKSPDGKIRALNAIAQCLQWT